MAELRQRIEDALDILKFDGAAQDTLAELRRKWGAQVPALLDERFDADGETLTTCGGMGPLLGYLPCSPHCKPEVREDNEIHNNYDFFRPVIRVANT